MAELEFTRQPFSELYDRRYVYHDTNQDMNLKVILKHIENHEPNIALQGEAGTGKTLLLFRIEEILPSPYFFIWLPLDKLINIPSIEAACYGQLSKKEFKVSQDFLFNQLEKVIQQKEQPVLIFDSVQSLRDDVKNYLIDNLNRFRVMNPELSIIWCGNEWLTKTLDDCSDAGIDLQDIHNINLRSLNKQQTRDYLQQRITAAGGDYESIINDNDVNIIYEESGGIPALINQSVNSLLEQRCQKKIFDQQKWLSLSLPIKSSAIIAAIALIFITLFIIIFSFKQGEVREVIVLPLPKPEPVIEKTPAADETPQIEIQTEAIAPTPRNEEAEEEIKNFDEQNWIVQLIVLSDPNAAKRYILEQNFSNGLVIERSQQDAKLYTVAIGPYPNEDAAQTAIDLLPDALQTGKPWARRLGAFNYQTIAPVP